MREISFLEFDLECRCMSTVDETSEQLNVDWAKCHCRKKTSFKNVLRFQGFHQLNGFGAAEIVDWISSWTSNWIWISFRGHLQISFRFSHSSSSFRGKEKRSKPIKFCWMTLISARGDAPILLFLQFRAHFKFDDDRQHTNFHVSSNEKATLDSIKRFPALKSKLISTYTRKFGTNRP